MDGPERPVRVGQFLSLHHGVSVETGDTGRGKDRLPGAGSDRDHNCDREWLGPDRRRRLGRNGLHGGGVMDPILGLVEMIKALGSWLWKGVLLLLVGIGIGL